MNRPVRLMFLILGTVAAVLAVVVGVYWQLKPGRHQPPGPLTPAQARSLQVDFDQMTTDLKDAGLVQFTVTLQASDGATKAELSDLQPEIEDLLNQTMRKYTADQLKTSRGLAQLKDDIRKAVNRLLQHGRVTEVYLPQIIVQ